MASSSISFSSLRFPSYASRRQSDNIFLLPSLPIIATFRDRPLLKASRKFSSYPQDAVVVVPDPRAWVGDFDGEADDDDDDDDDEEEEEEDRSLDLLVRFLHNVFGKISRRARKAARSVLPPSISTKLVRFSVNGVLILAFLWILKAFLEVACTLGSMVFLSILLVRGIWSAVSYMRENQYNYINRIDDDDRRWSGVQPAA